MTKQQVSSGNTIKDRIAKVMAEKALKARTWSIGAGLDPDLVRNILRGKSLSPRTEHLVALADFAGIDPDYLLMRNPEMTASPNPVRSPEVTSPIINPQQWPQDVPILGSAICGDDGLFELNGQIQDHARRPPKLMGVKDAYVLWVMGQSMHPWRKNGALVYVHPHQPVNIGDYVVVQLKPTSDGGPIPAYIKELSRRTAKDLRLLQYNPQEEILIPTSKVGAIHRIIDWSELMGI